MTEKPAALPKDHKLAKSAQTMTVGVTSSNIKPGDLIVLHGSRMIKVIVTDAAETIAEYENGAQRLFNTGDLSSYRELGTFPPGTAFYRQTSDGNESLFIEHINPSSYIVEAVDGANNSSTQSMLHEDLIAWHEGGHKVDPNIKLPEGAHLYVPKTGGQPADVKLNSTSEAAPEDLADDANNPFEADLQQEVAKLRKQLEQAHKDAEQAEINGQTRINSLLREVSTLRTDLLTQHDLHTTELLAKNDQIERLEAKAAILNPAPTTKEVCTLIQKLANPEDRQKSDAELAEKLNADWEPINITITDTHSELFDYYYRIVTLVRDMPADQPKQTLPASASTETPAPRPPVTQPPMPAKQSIVNLNEGQPANRWLTNNGPKPGETRKIKTPTELQARHEQNNAEIAAILERGAEEQEAIRRQAARQVPSFNLITGA